MKAVGLTRYLPIDHAESLLDLDLPTPEPGPRDLLVRVEAISVNPVDTKVRAPKDNVEPAPRVLGWDAAGVVERVGAEVTRFRPGDAVYYAGDITRPGSNAQFQAVDERIVGRKPRTLDFAEAAALPLTTITAYEALFDRLGLDPDGRDAGKSVLIIGGAGGVGSIAVQLARIAGLTAIATASRPESQRWVRELGASQVVDHRQPLAPQLAALGHQQVDYALNFANTDLYWEAIGQLLKPQGKACSIVENKGPLNQDHYKSKSLTHAWEFMFARAAHSTPDMAEQGALLDRVAGWIEAGRIRHTLTERLGPINAASLRDAHRRLESATMIGKLAIAGWQ